MNVYLEIFGYIGTALVLISMMMTSVVKLRLFNTIGSAISMTYSILCGAWPVVFLNGGLIIINLYQLIRLKKTKVVFTSVEVSPEDRSLAYFLQRCADDIAQSFPDYTFCHGENTQAYMILEGLEPVGVTIGQREGSTFVIELDYVTRKYRDCSIANFVFAEMKQAGITTVVADNTSALHAPYLKKMGFQKLDGRQIKKL